MEELLIEEKAKRYDSMFERLKEMYNNNKTNVAARLICERYFPELKECEDEKMMNQLHSWMKEFGGAEDYTEKVYQWIKGLLEKQGEQKPVEENKGNNGGISPNSEWGEEDEVGLGDAMWAIQQARTIAKDENDMGNPWYAERWLKSLKDRVQPKQQEWSEEDELRMENILSVIEGHGYPMEVEWLKSLRPQSTWKPSEEQLNALHWCVMNVGSTEHQVLQELLEQLEKLKD